MARRRRRWVGLLLLLALLAFILGRGLGLFPSPGATEGSTEPPPPAPSAEADGARERNDTPAKGDGEGAQMDRLHSLRSTLAAARSSGRLGAGYAAVVALRGSLPEAELKAARGELEAALQAALAGLREEVAQGRAILASRRLQALLQDGAAEVRSALDRFAGEQRWPAMTALVPQATVPAPVPLPRDLAVRAEWHGAEVSGRVVEAGSDEVTLRVSTEAGVTFPTLLLCSVEPEQPSAVLAAELGFAALRQGDGLLGRCWLACGLACGNGAPRLQELSALLK